MTENEPLPPLDLDTVSLLVPKAKNGSAAAKDELLEQIQEYMSLMARQNVTSMMQGKFGPSDVVQQSLAQVIQNFDNFRGNTKAEFYGWLRQIVTNEARKLQRNYLRDKRDIRLEKGLAIDVGGSVFNLHPADANPTPGTNAIAIEQIEQLHGAMEQLSEDHAEVIRLRSLEQLPFKEVADQMGRSVDSVTKMWCRAILKLQTELAPRNESEKPE